ncbi:murein hydrolase activator EnvC family protein [Amphibacillus xylanus]|uniref:Peptidase M23 family protein n=1 Tax=Amphibacillus xylanus (strain ATCC 51415 / DSM 6626 / JCM 7361 / LMG 17667 / NBRC 15112 / Ep01) TaxID=698758 RepID=K0IWF9_AMPXN|nr:peptidoglycan DD-metalloendopeptidase family protein [Amphibacillus xylanus]BAM46805.1 peptidase M23 family protein [Amphibacillus xylanus NBRC 15112]
MKRIITYILIVILAIGIVSPGMSPVSAKSIAELEKELQELREERSTISSEEKDAEEKIKQNEQLQAQVKAKISEIDGELEVTQANINAKQQEIDTTNQEIANLKASISETETKITETEAELEELEIQITDLIERIEERDTLIKNRLRSMQHNGGNINYLQVLFGAQSFTDFINRATAVSKILDSDKTIMAAQERDKADLEEMHETVEAKKEQLVADKAKLDEEKAEVESKRATLVAQQQELSNLKAQLNQQRDTQVATAHELEEEFFELEELKMSIEDQRQIIADQERVLKQLLDNKKEEERLAQLAQEKETDSGNGSNPPASSGGKLLIPVGGPYRISSKYGKRIDPFTRYESMHNGLDFARSSTNAASPPIISAEDGVVVSAGVRGGYGNTVVIHHPDLNLTTLYAHLASISVSSGQSVSRGEQVGIMGTTGRSTGIHLHFEVFEGTYGQNRVDPMKYLP